MLFIGKWHFGDAERLFTCVPLYVESEQLWHGTEEPDLAPKFTQKVVSKTGFDVLE